MAVISTLKVITALSLFLSAVNAGYAPVGTACPVGDLVRPADGLSSTEEHYRSQRRPIADAALKQWLNKINPQFDTSVDLPTLALSTSGGGFRSLLTGAGVVKGLDARDSNTMTSGLYQALTYHSGLSGGAWLISSIAASNFPTISQLQQTLWKNQFAKSLLVSPNLLADNKTYDAVKADLKDKENAGFPVSMADPWGRLLSYMLLPGADGGVDITLSSIAHAKNLTTGAAPLPILVSLGVKPEECLPGPNATTYEFTPYEFGSWDSDVSAFAKTESLGTSLSGGEPTDATCISNFDNLGFGFAASSNLFNTACSSVPPAILSSDNTTVGLIENMAEFVSYTHNVTTHDEYAIVPNPFYEYNSTSGVPNSANPIWSETELRLVDGSESLQNNPIWPLLQPARNVDVLIVNDNTADTANNFPNGSQILTTYVQSFNHNLTRMPYIPSVDTFLAKGLNKRPSFFGCDDPEKLTIVYIPNVNITYPSNQSTYKQQYSPSEQLGMISNGVALASQPSSSNWGTCLGCAILSKTGSTLPGECTGCFNKYCYNDPSRAKHKVDKARHPKKPF
ncbi:hypothetical protein DTO271G3_1681 [Paecilomyces variotii]|nr:hypothetical protein DTO271G3_1681 [Paecilomyces variotii]